jgi:hypothetical protein
MESFGNAASTDPAPKRSSFSELEVDESQTQTGGGNKICGTVVTSFQGRI